LRNFREVQRSLRWATARLGLMFLLALPLTALLVFFAAVLLEVVGLKLVGLGDLLKGPHGLLQPKVLGLVWWGAVALTCASVGIGGAMSWFQLRGKGGAAIAERLGGLSPEVACRQEPLQAKRLRNIVEEVAIAARLPVPQIFVLPQQGINAFAAGLVPEQAAIAVTEGALSLLTREELQGVVAHELGHIANGDLRLQTRLIAIVDGLEWLPRLGKGYFRILDKAGVDDIRLAALLLPIGAGLVLGGMGGLFGARLVQAALSRKREYLADATAVEFTRNPLGLANALKVIAGYAEKGRVRHLEAASTAHLFFVHNGATLWDTHPPLVERIRRLDPSFRRPERIDAKKRRKLVRNELAAMQLAATQDRPEARAELSEALHRWWQALAGSREALRYARQALDALPAPLRSVGESPLQAQAAVLALLLAPRKEVARKQWRRMAQALPEAVLVEVRSVCEQLHGLPHAARLLIAELAAPRLRELDKAQKKQLMQTMQAVIEADGRWDPLELLIVRLVLGWPQRLRPRMRLRAALGVALAALVAHWGDGEAALRQRLEEEVRRQEWPIRWPQKSPSLLAMDRALMRLQRMPLRWRLRVGALVRLLEQEAQDDLNRLALLRAWRLALRV